MSRVLEKLRAFLAEKVESGHDLLEAEYSRLEKHYAYIPLDHHYLNKMRRLDQFEAELEELEEKSCIKDLELST